MSRLQELIRELCPDGVEYKALGELLDYEQPGKYIVASTDYSDEYSVPVLTAGKGLLLGYTDETEGVYVASDDDPVIIFDDFTTSFHWITYDFKVKSSAMKMLRPTPNCSCCMFRYAYYAMKNIDYAPESHTRQWIGTYSAFRIPVPPIEVQREVVRILDEYTAAHDELVRQLEEEMALREQQLAIARNELLTFSERERVRWMALADIATFGGGHTPSKAVAANYEDGGIWWVTSKDVKADVLTRTGITISELGANTLTLYPRGTLVMVTRSGVLKRLLPVAFLDDDMTVNQDIKAIMPDESNVLSRYLFHVLKKDDATIREKYGKVGGTVDSVNFNMVKRHLIPVPPLDVQRRVVEQLDAYVTAHNELAGTLTEDIACCDQQLALVRNQLLSFPEKVA